MKRQWKRAASVLLAFLMVFAMAGCKKEEAKTETEKKEEVKNLKVEEKQKESEEVPEDEPENLNLLTGLADLSEGAVGKRPVAVMVNNVEDALPQYGVAAADIIYELPVLFPGTV